jgi:hypothetical protein
VDVSWTAQPPDNNISYSTTGMEDPKPGTTLALLTEEYELMEHMRDILSKK